MRTAKISYTICLSILFCFVFYNKPTDAKSTIMNPSLLQTSNQGEQSRIQELEHRLENLEPPEPTTILDSPFPFEKVSEEHFPTDTLPISEVLKKGTKIPFKIIKSEPDYIRPLYEEHWHSTYGRWSYIPSRIFYSLHRMFPFYAIGISAEYDFQHSVGIAFNTEMNETDLDLYIVIFQTDITDVYTKGNQVVIVGTPKRTGVEVISIKTGDLNPSNKEKFLLIQLATNGAELDYSLIGYTPSDFWLKQKANEIEKSKKD
ncbi:hypothetical protein ACOQFO_09530 [Ureibacillus sp. MALMAid1270]|uniref:hypothetical protein n=1 Tax=Ureibacillus sp. MALMAid1270 TaxID=3411629 RepID=UPI003BA7FE57